MAVPELRIVHHTAMQLRGGAVRVADMLTRGLGGSRCERTFEIPENPEGEALLAARNVALRLSGAAAEGAVLHLHAGNDWPALLESLAGQSPRIVLTLHDCRLFTGGCPFPLNCANLQKGCVSPCPRNFPDSGPRVRRVRGVLPSLDPVLVCPSRWMKEQALRHLGEYRYRVIPNGVEWPQEQPERAEARRRLGIDPAARVVLMAAHGGEKAAYKGGSLWRELWERIKRMEPRALGIIAGGDEMAREGDLFIWPFLEQEKLRLLMAAADVFLYPTLADNHPLVVLEAMASGTAVVAWAQGGIPEQIIDGENGYLVRPGDRQGLVARTGRLLANPRDARLVGGQAFAHGSIRFAMERMVRDYARLYASLLT